MKKNLMWILIAAIVIVGVGAFYGGMQYDAGKKTAAGQFGFNGQQAGANGARNRFQAGSMVNGTILSKDDKSITVKSRTGGSRIVFFSPSTSILKSVTGTVNDLQVNSSVTASGQTNSDGSVTAQMIQLRQDMANFGNASGTPNGAAPANGQ
jgi:hypothetical protein